MLFATMDSAPSRWLDCAPDRGSGTGSDRNWFRTAVRRYRTLVRITLFDPYPSNRVGRKEVPKTG